MAALGRLTRRHEFVSLTKRGRKVAMPGVMIQVRERAAIPGIDRETVRVGFTATRKIGGAVVRNRARRRLRAAAREVLPTAAREGLDIVLVARAGTATRPYAKLKTDIARALKRLDACPGSSGSDATDGVTAAGAPPGGCTLPAATLVSGRPVVNGDGAG